MTRLIVYRLFVGHIRSSLKGQDTAINIRTPWSPFVSFWHLLDIPFREEESRIAWDGMKGVINEGNRMTIITPPPPSHRKKEGAREKETEALSFRFLSSYTSPFPSIFTHGRALWLIRLHISLCVVWAIVWPFFIGSEWSAFHMDIGRLSTPP